MLSNEYNHAQVWSKLGPTTKTTVVWVGVTVVFVVGPNLPGHDYTFLKALVELNLNLPITGNFELIGKIYRSKTNFINS